VQFPAGATATDGFGSHMSDDDDEIEAERWLASGEKYSLLLEVERLFQGREVYELRWEEAWLCMCPFA
jgi:hypothetical protein